MTEIGRDGLLILLAELGSAWGYDVWIARNDHGRSWSKGRLGALSMRELPLPHMAAETRDTVELIDVLWADRTTRKVTAAFEVEKSTSIYSGILRLYDLALSVPECQNNLYLVAPEQREKDILLQLGRPAVAAAGVQRPSYILFHDLSCNCAPLARFGAGLEALKKIAKSAPVA